MFSDNVLNLFRLFAFTLLNSSIREILARSGGGFGRGGSSHSGISFATIQERGTSNTLNFPKYVAGASIAYFKNQEQKRPYFYSSSTHKYHKDWLVGICSVTVDASEIDIVYESNMNDSFNDSSDDNTTILHFECPDGASCCNSTCCSTSTWSTQITVVALFTIGYIWCIGMLTIQLRKRSENRNKKPTENGNIPTDASTSNGIQHIQLYSVHDLLAALTSPPKPIPNGTTRV